MSEYTEIADYLDHRAWQTEALASLDKNKAERAATATAAKTYREAAELVRRGAWRP